MVMKKTFKISFVLLLVLCLPLFSQFGNDPFGGSAEPDIDTEMNYESSLILFKFTMPADHHITDIKNGFFKIELEKNEFLEIADALFPSGIAYADEKVYKDKFEVNVYVKTLKAITVPINLKFKVSYQICVERPVEMCFAPQSQDLGLQVSRTFKDAEPQARTVAAQQAPAGKKTVARSPGVKVNRLSLLLIGLLLLGIAVFAGIFKPTEAEDIKIKFFKAFLVLIFLFGSFLYIKSLDAGSASENLRLKPKNPVKLTWVYSIAEGKAIAAKEGKKIMIDTYADWCVACKELDEYTFSDPEVGKILAEYVLIKVDFTKENETNKKLKKDLKVIGMPTVIFLDSGGKELRRFSGFYNKQRFLEFLGSGSGFFDKLLALLDRELEKRSVLLFLLVFGLGFLTSLTPCVYPVIPIVMGYIGTRSGAKKLKGLYLSAFFVLGLALVYSILGVIAATTGTMMGASFQNPVVVIVIAAIFIVMGLSLAGLFEIPVPSSISSKMQSGHKSEILGSLLIGGVAGVIAAPCVGPVLIALLSWISQTKDVVFGFFLTFTFSLGMGVIFLAVGTFSGLVSAMPKGGKWMDHIKHFFAAILIAGGIFIMNPILPDWITMLLWGIYFVVISVFGGLLNPISEGAIKAKIVKFIVVIIFLGGMFLLMKSLNARFFSPPQGTAVSLESGWLASPTE
jgi:thiol:disulfide interchange protein